MPEGSQAFEMLRDGARHPATASWSVTWSGPWPTYTVRITCDALDGGSPVEAGEDDAFEALCAIRDRLEPDGWRVGLRGALADVWPSGMARDQGGGLRAYRLTPTGAGDVVATFDPVDPSEVVTLAEQRAETDRLFDLMRGPSGTDGA
jgi:hypothetical protein